MGKDNRRSVDTKFWTDPEVEQLTKNATYLFNSLLTFPENNMAGTYEISEGKMSYYTKMNKNEINEAFKELEYKNKVLRFKTWVSIKNHIKNQKLNGGMAISVVKDLCDCPNPVKLWLFYQANSETLEPWFPKLLFNVNAYLGEQKKRYANRIVKDNPKITVIEALSNYEFNPMTEDKLLQIMVQNLPLDTKELSNLNSMITLIEWLDNPSMNIKNKRELEKELEDIKGKGNSKLISDNVVSEETKISPSPFSGFIPESKKQNPDATMFESKDILSERITTAIEHWNTKPNLQKYKYNVFNMRNVADVKTQFDVFSLDEILGAINNLSKYIDRDEMVSKQFDRFIKSSLDRWVDDAMPWKRYETEADKSPNQIQLEKYEEYIRTCTSDLSEEQLAPTYEKIRKVKKLIEEEG